MITSTLCEPMNSIASIKCLVMNYDVFSYPLIFIVFSNIIPFGGTHRMFKKGLLFILVQPSQQIVYPIFPRI